MKQTFVEPERISALPPQADVRCDRAIRLLDVGLDFCCKRSVAGEARGAVAASEDRTPRVSDLSGVEVVRRWCRLPRRSLMARFKTRPNPRTKNSSSQTRRRIRKQHRAQAAGSPSTTASLACSGPGAGPLLRPFRRSPAGSHTRCGASSPGS
jgi:hypothetical protein